MAASSPAMSVVPAAETTAVSTVNPLSSHNSKNLRGLNKPKCIKCGNVARSRCPYQSCKSCCAKAQNPCHIHVLKGNSSFPDKVSTSGSHLLDQQSTEVSHSGSSHRLRQLSNNFAQFNNLQAPFRSRKPLTRKDAQIINEWRFIKLKEFKDRNIDTENEAFDRYMQNAYLLGEVFMVNDEYDEQFQGEQASDKNSNPEEKTERMVNGLQLRLRSNSVRTENFRKRLHHIVDHGLSKLRKTELINEGGDNTSDREGNETTMKKIKSWEDERTCASNDLIEKMNQAQNKDDLKACQDMASQIFGPSSRSQQTETSDDEFLESLEQGDKPDLSRKGHHYSLPKWMATVDIDQESLCQIDKQFSALDEIENI